MVVLSLVLAGAGPGCGVILNRTGENLRKQQNASEPYADGLDTGTKKKKPAKPARAIVHTAAYDASEGLVDGALDALDQPKRRAQFEKLANDLETRVGSTTKTAGGGLVDGMKERLPELQPVLSKMLLDVKAELHLDPEAAARKVMKAAFAEAGTGMRDHLRPQVKGMTNDVVGSVRTGFEGLVGPGLKQKVHDNVVPALDEILGRLPETGEKLGKSAAKGMTDGLAASLDPQVDGSLGMRIDTLLDRSVDRVREPVDDWMRYVLFAALVIAIVALIAAVIRWLGERHARLVARQAQAAAEEQRARTEEMLTLVASAIQRAGANGSVEDFREEIKALSQDDGWLKIRAKLDEFLIRNKLKLERPRA